MAGPEVTEPLPYPERHGRLPAVGGLAAFAFCELCWQVLAVLALVYFAAQLVGMGLYGVEAWSRNGDASAVCDSALAAVRSQVIMLAVMVLFTCLGLGLLSVSNS